MKNFLKMVAAKLFPGLFAESEKKEAELPKFQKIRLQGVRKADKIYQYDPAKDEVALLPRDKDYVIAPMGVGPLVRAINEKNALTSGRKLHEKTMMKYEAISKAGEGKEGEDGTSGSLPPVV